MVLPPHKIMLFYADTAYVRILAPNNEGEEV